MLGIKRLYQASSTGFLQTWQIFQCICPRFHITVNISTRVSLETSFDSKQPKLEPKLVSALSETKCLFRLFRFYTKTESFDVWIEPKHTEDQPGQFDREHILVFFQKLRVFPVCFGLCWFVSKQFVSVVSLLY
jgi:hypothetical protein